MTKALALGNRRKGVFIIKKTVLIFLPIILFILLITVCGCNLGGSYLPEVQAWAKVTIITESEFDDKIVSTPRYVPSIDINDFRKLNLKVRVEGNDQIELRAVDMPRIGDGFNKYGNRTVSGFGSGTIEDGIFTTNNELIFFSAGWSEEEIKEVINSINISIKWVIKNGGNAEKEFPLGGYIEYE